MTAARKLALKKAQRAAALARKTAAVNAKRLAKSKRVQKRITKKITKLNTIKSTIAKSQVSLSDINKQKSLAKANIAALKNSSTKKYLLMGKSRRAKAEKLLAKEVAKQGKAESTITTATKAVESSITANTLKAMKQERTIASLTRKYERLAKPLTENQVKWRSRGKTAAVVAGTAATGAAFIQYKKAKSQ